MRSSKLLWYFSQLSTAAQEEVAGRMEGIASSEGFIVVAARSSEVFREVRREETQQHFERDVRAGHIKSLALENGLRDAANPQEAEEIVRSVMGPIPMWRDDRLRGQLAVERHYQSPAYKELHQRYVPQSGMGLYGGEPGFEGSPRMYVDPDRPHIPSIHVSDKINGTLRYAKYGYLKHELNIIDVDKLIRHARRLPSPEKLYFDLRTARRALSDASCAALIRYQRQRIQDRALIGQRLELLKIGKELFEQMLVVTIPPADAGVETHAEMIRCSALCGKFDDAVRRRAIKQMERNPERFVLSASFFDAVLEASVMCNRVEDGMDTFYQLLAVNLRPLQSSLDHVLSLLAQSMMPSEDAKLTSLIHTHGEDVAVQVDYIRKMMDRTTGALKHTPDTNDTDITAAASLEELPSYHGVMDKVDEVWALYEFFKYTPNTSSINAYLKCISLARLPDQAQLVLEYARKHSITMNEEGYLWAMFAFRPAEGAVDAANNINNTGPTLDMTIVNDFYSTMRSKGINPDHRHHQVALMIFGMCNDGESALSLFHDHVLPGLDRMNEDLSSKAVIEHLSVEMKMYALYAFARHPVSGSVSHVDGTTDNNGEDGSKGPHNEALFNQMRMTAQHILRHTEDNRAVLSVDQQLFEAFCLLCSKCSGAASDAFSIIKSVISTGCTLTPRMLNHMLLANANSSGAEGGSRYLTEDLLGLYPITSNGDGIPTQQTFMALGAAIERHGMTVRIEELRDQLLHRATAFVISTDADIEERLRVAKEEGATTDSTKDDASSLGGVQLSNEDVQAIIGTLPTDADLVVPVIPVHLLRRHFVPNNIRKIDIDLKKHSQRTISPTAPKTKNVTGLQAMFPLKEFEHHKDSMTINV